MTLRSESQDDMNKSTSDYVFWKINPGSLHLQHVLLNVTVSAPLYLYIIL